MTRIHTIGKMEIIEVALEKVELVTSPTGGAMEGTATLIMKTTNPSIKRLPPIRMTFTPKEEFMEEVLQEAIASIGLVTEKRVLPSE
jgi:hypothetical protein